MKPFTVPLFLVTMLLVACTAAASSGSIVTPTAISSASEVATMTAPATTAPSPTPEAVTAAVAFDGTSCTYAGATDLARGSRLTFLLINTPGARVNSIGGALIAGLVADGTTEEQIIADTRVRAADDPPAWFLNPAGVIPLYPQQADEGKTLTMTMSGNQYFVGIATPPNETNKMTFCALLKVFDR